MQLVQARGILVPGAAADGFDSEDMMEAAPLPGGLAVGAGPVLA